MIARLTGTLLESSYSLCVIDAGGVGYEAAIPLSTFDKLPHPGESVSLFIFTQVREDAIVLFGFATTEEKELFRQLINVSGVGGKTALNILSAMPVNNFCAAVSTGDLKALSRISGIGKRTAERLVVELKGKLSQDGKPSVFADVSGGEAINSAANDAALALEQLGFKREAIDKTIKTILAELPPSEQTSDKLLRQAIIKLNF
ncbi:MAG: Holliday junction branch migration protein RuvA [Victivallaceae bacterium]|nr:Holliday junction branch migration protein RuvA [Victivallaceae bacterium]